MEPTDEPYGVWMTMKEHDKLENKARSRISWSECVFAIFAMFFLLCAFAILSR